ATWIRDTSPFASDQSFGGAVSAQSSDEQPTIATLRDDVLERSVEAAMSVIASTVTVERCVVRTTAAEASDHAFGDGIAVGGARGGVGTVILDAGRIEGSARAGLSNFGSQVSMHSTVFECNPIALDGESTPTHSYSFQDLGDNKCGCAGHPVECTVL